MHRIHTCTHACTYTYLRIDDTCTFFSIRVKLELNTAIASRVKSAGGIRTRDRKFQAIGVDRSNHYSIETRHSKRWYATCE